MRSPINKALYVITVPGAGYLLLSGVTGSNIRLDINIYEGRACPIVLFAKVSRLIGEHWQRLLKERYEACVKKAGFLLEVAADGCELLVLSEGCSRGIDVGLQDKAR